MVLKFLKYLFILPFIFANAQSNLELIHSDNFETNYYFSNDASITNKLYVGCDVIRFFDESTIDTCAKLIQRYLKANGIEVDENYQQYSENVISFNIQLSKANISKLVPAWRKNFEKEWYNLVFSKIEPILNSNFSSFKNSTEGVFYSILQYEKRNVLSEYNMILKTNFAFVVNDKLPLVFFENRNVYTRNYRNTNTLQYTEAIVVNDLESEVAYSFPLVNKKSKITDCLSLNIIKQAIKEDDKLFLEYGVNQVVFTSIENDLQTKLELNKSITNNNFENIKNQALSAMKNSVNMDNLFFYSKYDLDVMERQIDSFNYNNFTKFLNELETSKYIISLQSENITTDSLTLLPFNIGIFNRPLLFKSNSSKFLNELDSNEIHKLTLFLKLNPEVQININGMSSQNEINKIEKSKIKALIRTNNLNKSEYSISRKTNLSLLRSVSIYNTLISNGIEKSRMKCNGTTGKNLLPSVIFQVEK
jgi:hypothetical protein